MFEDAYSRWANLDRPTLAVALLITIGLGIVQLFSLRFPEVLNFSGSLKNKTHPQSD